MIENSLNQEAGEKLAANQIRAKFKESEIISLKTGERSLTVSKGSIMPTAEWSHKDLMTIKVDRKWSGSDMEAISKVIRIKHGRKLLTPGFKEFMVYNNGSLMEYFSAVDLDFYKSETGTLFVRLGVLVKDGEKFTWKMIEKREQDAFNVKVKIIVDGGGGFFKLGICTVDVASYFSGDITKRSKLYQGNLSQPEKRNSVDQTLLLGIVPNTQENYDNCAVFIKSIDLRSIQFTRADLKLLNLILGIQTILQSILVTSVR